MMNYETKLEGKDVRADDQRAHVSTHLSNALTCFYALCRIIDKRYNEITENARAVLSCGGIEVLTYNGAKYYSDNYGGDIWILHTGECFKHIEQERRDEILAELDYPQSTILVRKEN